MPFPSPPWSLRGQLWVSLFAVRSGTPYRPRGLYGVAFVDYQQGSVLCYQELLVARLVRDKAIPRVQITDIWVNSTASRDGGRSLWAIPKELADVEVETRRTGRVARSTCSASIGGSLVATARFTSVLDSPLRTPFVFTTRQYRGENVHCEVGGTALDGDPLVATVTGNARVLPCRGSWRFSADGRLGWLAGRRPLLSLRMTDFAMSFGA